MGKGYPITRPGTPTGYAHWTVQALGDTLTGNIPTKAGPRTFWVRVPVDYDPNHKYRTVYIGQGCGGYEVADTQTLPLFNGKTDPVTGKLAVGGDEEAIYVALDIPRDMANQDCYDNRTGPSSQEWEAFELIHTLVDNNYCVDNNRVYVSGYSTGGWLQNMWGCYFAGDGSHPWNGTPGTIPTSNSLGLDDSELTSRAGNADGGAGDAKAGDGAAGSGGSGGTSGAAGSGGTSGTAGSGGTTGAAGSGGTSGAAGSGGTSGAAGSGGTSGAAGASGAAGEAGNQGAVDGGSYTPTAGQRRFAPEYHIRAQAGVSGGEPDNNPKCNGPIAAIWVHDKMDSNVYSANHDVALPRVLKMNGCYSANPPTKPWHDEIFGGGICVQYTDCPAQYPVVFCSTTMQGHADQHVHSVPAFTTFFQELETHMTPAPAKP